MIREVALTQVELFSGGEQPISGEIRAGLLEPFIAAVCAALGEMAEMAVVVDHVYQTTSSRTPESVAAEVVLDWGDEGFLILSFPKTTAAALARQILAGTADDVDESLVRDCIGEVANVVAGQAKALLAGTPYRFTFAVPQVTAGDNQAAPSAGQACFAVAFRCAHGHFTMQIGGIRQ
jgi:chemotaxis protein CheX